MLVRSNNTPFGLLLIGLFLILVSKSLLTEGMFVDGVTYASVSRNMAEGQGAFWNPHYTQTLYPEFRQHPPLAMGMEALAFKAFGDHWWVEKAYSALMFLISGLLIALIWKRTTNNLRWAWLPLLFWLAMPLVTWCATNNMLENTMSVFVLLSVYLMIVGYQRNHKIWLFLSAFTLLLAFLSKGFTGLFPLVFPILYCAFDQKRRWIQGPIDSLLLLVAVAVFAGIMFLVFPGSFGYIKDYIRLQVIGGGLYEATASSRFYIVFALLQQLIIPFALALVLVICKTKSKVNSKVFEFPPDKAWFYVFLIMGLVGVLPIMVSVKQRDFYMLAALPFFALACGHITLSTITLWLSRETSQVRRWMTLGAVGVLLIGLVMNIIHIGKYGRDEALIEEVKAHVAAADGKTILEITPEEYTQWAKHAYYMRYGKISLSPTEN
ncbi:MAG: glycosyltransferase family 39 protein [Bacteroidales bacterium]|nr:glycosyltransferase family 39 protein [Bacteroidales bacterium]MBR0540491.1 glycosyltransferase family 39 protein [Bacteroidales bacterium]